jgi:hypothetical protein
MVEKLDNLADKYGFTNENFDGKWERFIKEDHFKSDEFLSEAESIYGDLYKVGDNPQPKDLINRVFNPIKSKIHSKGGQEGLINAIKGINRFAIMSHNRAARRLVGKGMENPIISYKKANTKNINVVEKAPEQAKNTDKPEVKKAQRKVNKDIARKLGKFNEHIDKMEKLLREL